MVIIYQDHVLELNHPGFSVADVEFDGENHAGSDIVFASAGQKRRFVQVKADTMTDEMRHTAIRKLEEWVEYARTFCVIAGTFKDFS